MRFLRMTCVFLRFPRACDSLEYLCMTCVLSRFFCKTCISRFLCTICVYFEAISLYDVRLSSISLYEVRLSSISLYDLRLFPIFLQAMHLSISLHYMRLFWGDFFCMTCVFLRFLCMMCISQFLGIVGFPCTVCISQERFPCLTCILLSLYHARFSISMYDVSPFCCMTCVS